MTRIARTTGQRPTANAASGLGARSVRHGRLVALALACAAAVACGGGRPPVRDLVDTLPPTPAQSVGDLVGRWESTSPGVAWVWLVDADGKVEWIDGQKRTAAHITTQNGRVLFMPPAGPGRVFTLYLLPSHRLLLRDDRGVRMILTDRLP